MEYRKQIDTTEGLAKWYDEKYLEMGDGWNTPPEECNRHLDDLGVPFDKTMGLLDVGCGAGHFLAEAEKRVTATGMEISVKGVQLSRARARESVIMFMSIEDVSPECEVRHDYIVSLGSLEHIVDIGKALDNIALMLKPEGKFYFFCPNELWKHFDQPNERNMTDDEWINLFAAHGLITNTKKRWNDSTAFIGQIDMAWMERIIWDSPEQYVKTLPPHGTKLNIGSGQRRFENAHGWVNVDCVSRPPDQVPDLVCDVGIHPLPYPDNSMEIAVLHQVYEHFGLGEGHGIVREIYRTLKPGGSLILTLPNMRMLAEKWLSHQIDDYIYFVNVYGAYQGEAGDRHQWGYSGKSIIDDLSSAAPWGAIRSFNWRPIPGADIAKDWWIMGIEAIK